MEAAKYLPISLTCHLIKIGERVLRKKLVHFLEFFKKMDPKQKFTLSQLLVCFDEIIQFLENKENIDLIYLDF